MGARKYLIYFECQTRYLTRSRFSSGPPKFLHNTKVHIIKEDIIPLLVEIYAKIFYFISDYSINR